MMSIDLEALAGFSLDEMEQVLAAAVQHKQNNLLDFWTPYPKQLQFFNMGAKYQERLLTAGNQVGKSDTGAAEAAYHLTGLYPGWWEGRRWDRPTNGWICSESTTVGRDVAQSKLCGPAGVDTAFGTGLIPRHLFAERPTLARGAVADAYDTIQVYHHTKGARDGVSTGQFKSYEQGRKKFQGKTNDWNWWDEEPDQDIYEEGNSRWSATGGMSWMTFTPMQGRTHIVETFQAADAESLGRGMLRMSAHDAAHMTPERIQAIRNKFPKYTWGARIDGYPMLGSGGIFTIDENLITFPVTQFIPQHWPLLWGIDFGITHPFAAVLMAWDRDKDVVYFIATYRAADALPIVHAEAIRRICAAAPVAWPHDGHNREKGSGESVARLYGTKKGGQGLHMLPSHATWPDGGISTEAAVSEWQQREADGRLRLREDLGDLLEERRGYFRKDGLIVKERDDLISAGHKCLMAKRHARMVPMGYQPRPNPQVLQNRPSRAPARDPFTGRPLVQTDNRRPWGDREPLWEPTFRG